MMTAYGEMSNQTIKKGLDRYISKVYKILPMKEEGCDTLDQYIESLLREFVGFSKVVKGTKHEDEVLSLVNTLQNLSENEVEVSVCKSDVFKSIGVIKKIKNNLRG